MSDGHEPTLTDLLDAHADERDREKHRHCVLASVISYDDSTRSCSVRPLQGVTLADGTWEPLADIHSVPVELIRWGGFVIAVPLQQDDVVRLTFSDASLERWLTEGGTSARDPEDPRAWHMSDAIATPAPDPNKASLAFSTGGDLVIGRETGGVQIRLSPTGGVSITKGAADFVALLQEVVETLGNPSPAGGTTVSTMLGAQPLSSAASLAAIAAQLATFVD